MNKLLALFCVICSVVCISALPAYPISGYPYSGFPITSGVGVPGFDGFPAGFHGFGVPSGLMPPPPAPLPVPLPSPVPATVPAPLSAPLPTFGSSLFTPPVIPQSIVPPSVGLSGPVPPFGLSGPIF